MDHPEAPIFPVLDNPCLFRHLPTKDKKQYLQCAATGHLYCVSTGSLYPVILLNPLFVDSNKVKEFNQFIQGNSTCINIIPTAKITHPPTQVNGASTNKTMNDKSSNTKHRDQHLQGNCFPIGNMVSNVTNADPQLNGNTVLSSQSTQKNRSPTDKHGDQPIQGNSASVMLNKQVSDIYNVILPVHDNGPKPTSKLQNADHATQGDKKSVTPNRKGNKKSNFKMEDQPVQGTSASINSKNKASNIKTDKSTQGNSPLPSAGNNSDPTTKKKKKNGSRTKNKSVPSQDNFCAGSKKKSDSSKKNKSTLSSQPKSTRSLIDYSAVYKTYSSVYRTPASSTQTAKQHVPPLHSDHKLSATNKKKSYTYYKFYLNHTIKLIQPIEMNLQDLVFPQNVSFSLAKYSRKHEEGNVEINKVYSLSDFKYKYAPNRTKKRKLPSLNFTNEDYCSMYLQDLNEKTTKKKYMSKWLKTLKQS
ncbi:hypothetical protein GDO81_020529 [Engystomops pustulosus]|uniref:Uncharacterized protein n=1 Tax=Engystomops pustulosus TaxID=76066 RepID=A0AAV6YRH7_ENGPU|nr:hypothetical protein GDO81_020529 [Engystomops pustulosus]